MPSECWSAFPNPRTFLAQVREFLYEEGDVIVRQPMQDVPSYDVFFVDHLHHFTTDHVRWLGDNVGYTQIRAIVATLTIQNFSLHHFRNTRHVSQALGGFQGKTSRCAEAIAIYQGILSSLNDCLAKIRENEQLAVFGTGEVFTLLYTYSNLHRMNILCGLDDNTDRRRTLGGHFRS